MTWNTSARKICTAGAVLALAALLPAASFAQSAYPTGKGMRANRGQNGYFDVVPGKSHSIADVKDTGTYRVCIVGNGGKLIVDGKKEVPLDNGDCHDASGKTFVFKADSGGEEDSEGTYWHVRRDN